MWTETLLPFFLLVVAVVFFSPPCSRWARSVWCKRAQNFGKTLVINRSINTGTRLSWFLYVSESFLSQEGRTVVSSHLGRRSEGSDRRATKESTVRPFNKVQTTGNVARGAFRYKREIQTSQAIVGWFQWDSFRYLFLVFSILRDRDQLAEREIKSQK